MNLPERFRLPWKQSDAKALETLRGGYVVKNTAADRVTPAVYKLRTDRIDFEWGSAAALIENADHGGQPEDWVEKYLVNGTDVPLYERVLHIRPIAQEKQDEYLVKQMGPILVEMNAAGSVGRRSVENQYKAHDRLRKEIGDRVNSIFYVASYYLVRDRDPDKLREEISKLKRILANRNIDTFLAHQEHQDVMQACAPNLRDPKGAYHIMPLDSLEDRAVFSQGGLYSESPFAIIIGKNPDSDQIVSTDRLDPSKSNRHEIYFGPPGEGKTLMAIGSSWDRALRGERQIFVDPKGTDWEQNSYYLSGQYARIGANSRIGINPLHPPMYNPKDDNNVNPLGTHIANFNEFFLTTLQDPQRPYGPQARALMDEVVFGLYEKFGIEKSKPYTLNKAKSFPLIGDLADSLRDYVKTHKGRLATIADELAYNSSFFTSTGSIGSVFSRETDIRFDKTTGFGLGEISTPNYEHLLKPFMRVILDFILRMRSTDDLLSASKPLDEYGVASSTPFHLVIDEGQLIDDDFVYQIFARARGLNMGVSYIAHELSRVNERSQLRTVAKGSNYAFIFKHLGSGADEVGKILGLNEEEVKRIRTLKKGEAFFMDGPLHTVVKKKFTKAQLNKFGTADEERMTRLRERMVKSGINAGFSVASA